MRVMVHKDNAQMNRRLLWDDLLVDLKGKPHGESVIQERGDCTLPEKYQVSRLELSEDLRMLSPTLYGCYRYARRRRAV